MSPDFDGALTEEEVRREVAEARRIVIKVGSSSLSSESHGLNTDRVAALVRTLADCHDEGHDVVLVSSGAIAAGLSPLGLRLRPRDLAHQQAAAAVGQGLLMQRYTELFNAREILVGQVLLTVEDLTRKASYTNALRTLGTLLRMGAVPIINENDAVATHEVRFGDNDRLADYIKEIGRTTSSTYGSKIRSGIASGNIDTAVVSDYWIGNADPNIVTWVESHDNYINDCTYNNIDSEQVVLGWAIITARKDGTPLFFDRPYNSSIDNSWGMNRIGTQGDDMYKDNRVSAVNFFRTAMKGEDENLVNPNLDSTALMIERGTKGAVIVNTNDALKVDFETNLADGTYVDRVDRKTEYTVKNGKITCDTDIPENSVVVLYNEGYTEYARPASVGVDSKTEFTYSDDTYEVTLTCSNTDNATYSLDGGKAVSYKDGDKVTIKHGDSDVSKLELRAENAEGVKTYERLEFTYM